MIFVIVGTHPIGFPRLFEELDMIAPRLNDKITAQIGHNKILPKNFEYFRFIEDDDEFRKHLKNADIVICHGGAGSILDALFLGKRVVVVPRLSKLKEHSDDHQLELSKKLNAVGFVDMVLDIKKLRSTILKVKKQGKRKIKEGNTLRKFIGGWLDDNEQTKRN